MRVIPVFNRVLICLVVVLAGYELLWPFIKDLLEVGGITTVMLLTKIHLL